MAFDHIGFSVSDFPASRAFYVAALAPLGIAVLHEGEDWAAFGTPGNMMLWIGIGGPAAKGVHIAFVAEDHAAVHAFHEAAITAVGRDNGGPGPRPQYSPTYYAAFAFDPDGHNIEAVCRKAG